MDPLSSSKMFNIYLGEVVNVDERESWKVTFRFKGFNPNSNALFTAIPIVNHTHEILPGTQVLLFRQADNGVYYYHPITQYQFVGNKFGTNVMDITDKQNMFVESAATQSFKNTDTKVSSKNNIECTALNDIKSTASNNIEHNASKDIKNTASNNIEESAGNIIKFDAGTSLILMVGETSLVLSGSGCAIIGNTTINGTLSVTGNISTEADIKSSGVSSLNAHRHGNGNMGSPTTAPLG